MRETNMPKKSHYIRRTVTLAPELNDKLLKVATETDSTVSEIVNSVVSLYFSEHQPHATFMGYLTEKL